MKRLPPEAVRVLKELSKIRGREEISGTIGVAGFWAMAVMITSALAASLQESSVA